MNNIPFIQRVLREHICFYGRRSSRSRLPQIKLPLNRLRATLFIRALHGCGKKRSNTSFLNNMLLENWPVIIGGTCMPLFNYFASWNWNEDFWNCCEWRFDNRFARIFDVTSYRAGQNDHVSSNYRKGWYIAEAAWQLTRASSLLDSRSTCVLARLISSKYLFVLRNSASGWFRCTVDLSIDTTPRMLLNFPLKIPSMIIMGFIPVLMSQKLTN